MKNIFIVVKGILIFLIVFLFIPSKGVFADINGYDINIYLNNKNIKEIEQLTVIPGETIDLDIELKKVGIVKAGDKIIVDLPNIFSNVQFQPTAGFKAKVIGNQLIIMVEPFEEAGITIFPFGGYLKSRVKISEEISNTSGKIIINNRPIKITIKNDEKKNQNSKGENQKPSTGNENPDIYKGAIGKNFLSYLYNDWTYWEQVEFNQLKETYKYALNVNGYVLYGLEGKIVDSIPWGMLLNKDTVKVYDQNSNDVTKGFENDINVINNQGSQSLEINYKGFKKENYTVYYDLEITKELRDVIKVGTNRYLYNQVEFISKGKVICSNWAQIEVMNLPFLNTTLDKEIISSELYNHIGSELTYKLSIKGDQGNIKAVRAIDFAPKGTTIIPSSISVYQGGFGRQQIDVKVEKITSDNMVFKNATVVVDPEGKEIYVYIPETNYQNFYINYNLQVNAIYPSIENKVTVYSEGAKIVKQTIAKYEGTGGAIIAWKTSDKNIINNNGIINYKINLNSYGEFGSNYVNILDDLPKGLIIKNVNIEGAEKIKANYKNGVYNKVEGGFNISYGKSSDGSYFVNAYNSEIINNGDNIILNIEAVIGDLQKGTTISNTAIINGNATNTVDIKYGYRIKGEKVYKEKGLAGAIFNLYNGKGQFIEKIESDENGVIDFTVKEPNDYYLKEIKAPKGFQLKKEKFNFKVTENDVGTTINIGEIENEKVKIIKNYKVKLLKVDKDTNEGLEGAEFKLFDENNNYLKTLISNENGEIEFNLFKSGEYYLEEVKAPKGYRLNKEKLLFQIKENDKEIVDIGLIKNEKIKEENYYKVKGKKVVEESKRPLNGAVFELFTEGGNYIKRIESKDDGSIEFTVNKEGTYYLKEIKAPKGFYLNKDKLYFKVSAEDGNKEIDIGEIKNKGILPKVYK